MFVSLQGVADVPVRPHPYRGARYDDPRVAHYDFVKHPELIRQVLEDFKPWERYRSVESFYRLLEWVNGKDSLFESSDCRMVPPQRNSDTRFQYGLVLQGRVMILIRDLEQNLASLVSETEYFVSDPLARVATHSYERLSALYPDIASQWIQILFFPERYRDAQNRFGHQITFQFNSFGNTEESVFTSFHYFSQSVLDVLNEANEMLSEPEFEGDAPAG